MDKIQTNIESSDVKKQALVRKRFFNIKENGEQASPYCTPRGVAYSEAFLEGIRNFFKKIIPQLEPFESHSSIIHMKEIKNRLPNTTMCDKGYREGFARASAQKIYKT